MAQMPESEEALVEWAQARFQEKDELMAHFSDNGAFPGAVQDAPLPLGEWFRSVERKEALTDPAA